MIIDYSVDIPGDATVSRALKIGKFAFPFSKSETGRNPCFMQGFFYFPTVLGGQGKGWRWSKRGGTAGLCKQASSPYLFSVHRVGQKIDMATRFFVAQISAG